MPDFSRISFQVDPMWFPSHPDEKPVFNVVNIEALWERLAQLKDDGKEEEVFLEMREPKFWQLILPHTHYDKRAQQEFLTEFSTDAAHKNRLEAIFGLKKSRKISDKLMIDACFKALNRSNDEFLNDFDGPEVTVRELQTDSNGKEIGFEEIGFWIANILAGHKPEKGEAAHYNDYIAISNANRLRTIADWLVLETEENVDLKLIKSITWREFCLYVLENKCLPTVSALQSLTDLGQGDYGRSEGRKVRKKLGIGAMPKV